MSENIAVKRENDGNQHFLLFQRRFLPNQRQVQPPESSSIIRVKFNLSSANAFNLDMSKILSSGKALKVKCEIETRQHTADDTPQLTLYETTKFQTGAN